MSTARDIPRPRPRPAVRAACAAFAAAGSLAGCGQEPDRPAQLDDIGEIRNLQLWQPEPPALERAPAPRIHGAGPAPAVVYLWYADGGPPPTDSRPCMGQMPPAYQCRFGVNLDDCKRQVQRWLDEWYSDFNVVFTLKRPTTGVYYTSIVTSSGAWCNQGPTVGGVAPINCTNLEGFTSFAFLCGINAKTCAAIVAQEQAHTVGLTHSTSRLDVMYPSVQAEVAGFENRENPVSGGLCRKTQNSYQMMLASLGPWPGGPKPNAFDGAGRDGGAPAAPRDGAALDLGAGPARDGGGAVIEPRPLPGTGGAATVQPGGGGIGGAITRPDFGGGGSGGGGGNNDPFDNEERVVHGGCGLVPDDPDGGVSALAAVLLIGLASRRLRRRHRGSL